MWKLGHRPALDGLRGVAVLLVVSAHAVPGLDDVGIAGVTVFFTLSGFLITALLLTERDGSRGRISFAHFYRNRALRLMPAFLAMLAVVVPLSYLVLGRAGYWWSALVESSNWVIATKGAGSLDMLTHTWSLSIEEQFYLVWPLVLVAVSGRYQRRGLVAVAASGIAVSVVLANVLEGPRATFGTDTNASALLIGCLLAALMVGRTVPEAPAWAAPLGAGLVLVGFSPPEIALPFVPVGAGLLIWTAVTRRAAGLTWRPLRFAGRISYGWYLWNYPVLILVLEAGGHRALSAPISLAIALLSWRVVEQPFLRLKSRGGVVGGETSGREGGAVVGDLVDDARERIECRVVAGTGAGAADREVVSQGASQSESSRLNL